MFAMVVKRTSTRALAKGATVLIETAALDQADVDGGAARVVGERMQLDDLAAELLDRADALVVGAAGVRRHARDLDGEEHRSLAAAHDVAAGAGRPGLGIEDRASAARRGLDHGPRGGRGDLLVRGEQPYQRQRPATDAGKGLEHESVHHEARLHVGDAGAEGELALDAERARLRRALGKDRVAMAEQQDVVVGPPSRRHRGFQEETGRGVVGHLAGDAARFQMRLQDPAGTIDARLVRRARIGIDQRAQQATMGSYWVSSQASTSASRGVIGIGPPSGDGPAVSCTKARP